MSKKITSKVNIEKLEFNINMFKDKTILLLGTSGTGKSKIILDIMHTIKDEVPVSYIFCPTNSVNDTFTGIVPDCFISEDVDVDKLENIIKMQEIRMKIYKKCNDKQILTDIAFKLNDSIAVSYTHLTLPTSP
jgi:ABC-type dipeptide/oligopeptide/nickel transport system ATPase component